MFLFYSHIYTKLSEQKLRNFVTRITAQHWRILYFGASISSCRKFHMTAMLNYRSKKLVCTKKGMAVSGSVMIITS
jgi:hypothetical protein